jgi:hypothetical protein
MARRRDVTTKCGLVQIIHQHWTKASRGGEGARARSSVPLAFVMPTAELSRADGVLSVDVIRWGEQNAFAEPHSTDRRLVSLADGYTFGCVTVTADTQGVQAFYRHDGTHGGAPERQVRTPAGHFESFGRCLQIRDGEWVRVCYNGRFSDHGTGNWWYQQVTVNVAWFTGYPNGQVFLEREPAQELRDLVDLW